MNYKQLNDQFLLQAMAKGDENALSEFYDRYHRLVYSMALNSLAEPALAEEVTQDVFLRIWNHADSYQADQGKVSTWLVRIARNRAIDEIRRKNVRPESNQIPWDQEEKEEIQSSTNVEELVSQREQKSRVRQAIAQLPDDQRQALTLAYFQGYSHREISELVGEPLGTIKTRLRLAMKKLQQALAQEDSNPNASKPSAGTYL